MHEGRNPMKNVTGSAGAIGALLFIALLLPVGEAVASGFADDFEDGSINGGLWVTHGYLINGGAWQYSFDEVTGTDGYLNAHVWGPPSANTYGAEAWVMTVQDFNTGDPWLVNFTWGTTLGGTPPINGGAISISVVQVQNPPDTNEGAYWIIGDDRPHFRQLWRDWPDESYLGGGDTPNRPFTGEQWSVVFDPSGVASFYQTPNGEGTPYRTVELDTYQPWYLGFFMPNFTAMGYGSGDSSFQLYDFSACPVPEPATLGVLGLAFLVGMGRLRQRISR
jgi:hypothetical protein